MELKVKKKLGKYIFFNVIILLLTFGSLAFGLGFFATTSSEKMAKNGIVQYSDVISSYTIEELKNACTAEVVENSTLLNPNYYYAIYTRRSDGSLSMLTRNQFLRQQNPVIGGKLAEVTKEKIAGNTFLTYTTNYNMSNTEYIKIFVTADWTSEAGEYVGVRSIGFILSFFILSFLVSVGLAYFEIRPAINTLQEQKNFINDMSHEIRTPLAIIKGNLENLKAIPNATIEEVGETIDECLEEVDYMTTMSTGLLNVVKSGTKSNKTDAKMSDVVGATIETYADLASISNKSLIANIETCNMPVDKAKIKELLSILIDNSLKYTRDGDKISVKLKNNDSGCVLTVADTGIGVSQDEIPKLFERFFRAENAKSFEGTGLGLTIAKSIVESMNGTIKANRNYPKGLEIAVSFRKE